MEAYWIYFSGTIPIPGVSDKSPPASNNPNMRARCKAEADTQKFNGIPLLDVKTACSETSLNELISFIC